MNYYLVGGAVRDKLLNYPFSERDWVVTGATPQEMTELGFRPVGKDFPVFLHPRSQEEYALARTERKTGTGYRGFTFNCDPNITLEDDLSRRDLTINAMAQDASGELIDPYGGKRDLDNKILKHVSDAFSEDPLRVLRCARFLARYYHLGFVIAESTLKLMTSLSQGNEISSLSAERIWLETSKALNERNPSAYFETLQITGADKAAFGCTIKPVNSETLDHLSTARLRWAYLVSKDNHKLNSYRCLPNEIRKSAENAIFCRELCDKGSLTAVDLFTLMTKYNAVKNADQLNELIEFYHTVNKHPTNLQWHKIQEAASTVSAKEFIKQGLNGAQIGEAIRARQIEVITALI